MSNDLSKYSGGPNPFVWLRDLVHEKVADKDKARSTVHDEVLKSHIEYANTVHQHALDLHAAHVEGRIKEVTAYNKLAKPGTPLQAQVGESSVSLVTREPKTRAPKAPAKPAPKPLPVRDPKTGRATKAPQ